MTKQTTDFLACDDLANDVANGLAIAINFGDQGSTAEPHYISLLKLQTSLGDPTQRYKPKNGTHFFTIRPNEVYTSPSHENGKDWNWYLLSCPHQPPCPFMLE